MSRVASSMFTLASWADGFRGLKGFAVTGNRVVRPDSFGQSLEV